MLRSQKSILSVTTTLAALTAAVVLTAPDASASVWNVSVAPGASVGLGGTQYGTSCSYTVTVEGTAFENVWFDDNIGGTVNPGTVNLGSSGRATVTWMPYVPGWHRIDAWTPHNDMGAWVNVGTGINLGSACVVR